MGLPELRRYPIACVLENSVVAGMRIFIRITLWARNAVPFLLTFSLSLYRCCFGGHWQQLYCYWVLDTFKKKHVLPVLLIADCQCVSATIVLSMLRLLLLVTCVCTYETVICCVYGKPYQTINTMGTDLCHDDNVVASETHKQKTRRQKGW